jgi:hypothetical protein
MKPLEPENAFSPLRLVKSMAVFGVSGPVLLAGFIVYRCVWLWREHRAYGYSSPTDLVFDELQSLDIATLGYVLLVVSTPGLLLGVCHYLLVRSKWMRQRGARRRAGLN